MSRAGELAAARPVCGVCAIRKRPTWVGPATTPRMSGTSVVRSEMTPVAMLDWITNERMPRTSSPSSFAGADGNHDGRDRLRDDDGDEHLGDTHGGGDDDGEQSEPGRARLIDPTQVVAAVQQQRRRADVLGRLHER